MEAGIVGFSVLRKVDDTRGVGYDRGCGLVGFSELRKVDEIRGVGCVRGCGLTVRECIEVKSTRCEIIAYMLILIL